MAKKFISEKPPIVQAEATRCPACGSTERTGYQHTDTQEYAGTAPNGQPYTHILRRWCKCVSCGQVRIDRTYENRV